MKTYIKIIGLLMAIVIVVGFGVPSFVLNGTVFAKGETNPLTIGGVSVEELNSEEVSTVIRTAVEQWQEKPFIVSGGGIEQEIDTKDLQFDVEQVVAQYETLTKKPWYAFWQRTKKIQLPIPVEIGQQTRASIEAVGYWQVEKTIDALVAQTSYLGKHQLDATMMDLSMLDNERLAFQISEIPSHAKGIGSVLDALNNTLLTPNETISLLRLLGEQAYGLNGEVLNFLGSVLYSTVLQTDYAIVERHAQVVPSADLQQGLEAEVNVTLAKDLQFINTSEQLSKLHATVEGNQLKIEILSAAKDKDVTVRVTKDKIVKPRVITRYSDELAAGRETVEQEGQEGVRIEVYRSIRANDGTSEEQLVSRDYYAPTNRIVVRSSKKLEISEDAVSEQQKPTDSDLQMDLDGNGFPDATPSTTQQQQEGPETVYGYYDKGGNFVQTSP